MSISHQRRILFWNSKANVQENNKCLTESILISHIRQCNEGISIPLLETNNQEGKRFLSIFQEKNINFNRKNTKPSSYLKTQRYPRSINMVPSWSYRKSHVPDKLQNHVFGTGGKETISKSAMNMLLCSISPPPLSVLFLNEENNIPINFSATDTCLFDFSKNNRGNLVI